MCLGRSKPRVTPFFLLLLLPFFFFLHLSTAGSQQLPRGPVLSFPFPPSTHPLLPASPLPVSPSPAPLLSLLQSTCQVGLLSAAIYHCKGAHIKGDCTAAAARHHGCSRDDRKEGPWLRLPEVAGQLWPMVGMIFFFFFATATDREPSRAPSGHFRRAKTCWEEAGLRFQTETSPARMKGLD